MYMYVESRVQRWFYGALRSSKLHHITFLGILHRALQFINHEYLTIDHLVETSASFTEQLSCPQRIFVLFMQIATENDITSYLIALQIDCRMQMQHMRYRIFLLIKCMCLYLHRKKIARCA